MMTDRSRSRWDANIADEVEFWDRYLGTAGLDWPDEFARRIDRDAMLQESQILQRLPAGCERPVRILDVGAGPLTVLGTRAAGCSIEIVAIDPLARHYDALLARHGIDPPVRTLECHGEELAQKFSPESFDFAYARNALDHAYDPCKVIRNMTAVVRPGGWVILRHRPNEAERAGYEGLHQWNFEERNGEFWVSSPERGYNMRAVLGDVADVTCHRDGEWLVCTIHRLSDRRPALP